MLNKGLVIVSGCFDPLHNGHIELFLNAKKLGTKLGVVVESDDYVKSKHPLILGQAERAAIVAQLSVVDFVIFNDVANGDCSKQLSLYRPEFYCCGPNYHGVTSLPEYNICSKLGIKINRVMHDGRSYSSSQLVQKMQPQPQPQYINPPVTVSMLGYYPSGRIVVSKRPTKTEPKQLGFKWDLPGGFLEPGESLETCLLREIKEEWGINLLPVEMKYAGSLPAKYEDERIILSCYFLINVTGLDLRTVKQSDESIDVKAMDKQTFEDVCTPDSFYNEVDYRAIRNYFSTR